MPVSKVLYETPPAVRSVKSPTRFQLPIVSYAKDIWRTVLTCFGIIENSTI